MKRIKIVIPALAAAALIVFVTADAERTAASVRYSLSLCYSSVIPALFPCFMLCRFFGEALGALPFDPSAALFLSSLVTGFPAGVKGVCDAYSAGMIGRDRACALLCCTGNASPAYLIAFVGACLAGSARLGAVLLAAQTLCAVTLALAFGCFDGAARGSSGVFSVTEAAVRGVEGAVKGVLNVCGYTVIFGVFADAASGAGPLCAGALEITRGVKLIDFTAAGGAELCAVLVGFSGASVIMQCLSCVTAVGLPVRPLLTGRLIYTVLIPVAVHVFGATAPPNAHSGGSAAVVPALFIIFLLFCGVAAHNIFDKRRGRRYNINGDKNDFFKRDNSRMRLLRIREADRNDRRRDLL